MGGDGQRALARRADPHFDLDFGPIAAAAGRDPLYFDGNGVGRDGHVKAGVLGAKA